MTRARRDAIDEEIAARRVEWALLDENSLHQLPETKMRTIEMRCQDAERARRDGAQPSL